MSSDKTMRGVVPRSDTIPCAGCGVETRGRHPADDDVGCCMTCWFNPDQGPSAEAQLAEARISDASDDSERLEAVEQNQVRERYLARVRAYRAGR